MKFFARNFLALAFGRYAWSVNQADRANDLRHQSFLLADELLIFDRVSQTVTVLVNAIIEDGVSPAEAYENAIGEIDRLVSLLEQPLEEAPVTTLQSRLGWCA